MAVAVVAVGEGHGEGVVAPAKRALPEPVIKTTEAGHLELLPELGCYREESLNEFKMMCEKTQQINFCLV